MNMIRENVYKYILENQENGFIILNKNKEVVYVNKVISEIYGVSNKILLGNYLKCIYSLNEKMECQETSNCQKCKINYLINDVIKNNIPKSLSGIDFNFNGTTIKLNLKVFLVEEFLVIEIFNFTKEQEKMQYLIKILDYSQDLLFFKDSELKYKYLNVSFAKFFNREKEEIYDKTDKELLPEDLYYQCIKSDLDAVKKGSYIGIENFNNRYYQVLKESVNGGVLGIAKDITDVLEQKRLAELDSLTELYNRRKFLSTIDYIYENKIDSYYLILIDLDNLRDLNNNFGHIKGDEYLRRIGSILNNYPEGIFFRIGGDEFSGLINRNKHEVNQVLKKIYNDLSTLKLTPKLSISSGAKKFDITKNYLENYSETDKLLYEAKIKGKGCYVLK